MKFITDHDIYFLTVKELRQEGCDVVTAREINMHRATDEELLNKAKELDRILITRDKGFGALVFLRYYSSSGVILLRISPENLSKVHRELFKLLKEHSSEELQNSFCVVEENGYRIRKLPGK